MQIIYRNTVQFKYLYMTWIADYKLSWNIEVRVLHGSWRYETDNKRNT